ncbi:MAG: GDSL-type esterase/lipase family protein [Proteobacteria bacterium]|nr:GDSL-type esterase/lipase family protein [Pseudomonadota bacterium]
MTTFHKDDNVCFSRFLLTLVPMLLLVLITSCGKNDPAIDTASPAGECDYGGCDTASSDPESDFPASATKNAVSEVVEQHNSNKVRMLLLGDSLSAGCDFDKDCEINRKNAYPYVALNTLRKDNRDIEIIDASIPRSSTSGGVVKDQAQGDFLFASALERLDCQLSAEPKPTHVLIALGADDVLHQKNSISTIRKNITQLVQKTKDAQATPLLAGFINPSILEGREDVGTVAFAFQWIPGVRKWGNKVPGNNYTDKAKYALELVKLFESIAQNTKVKLWDDMLENIFLEPEYSTADGLHPNEEGHRKIASRFIRFLRKEVPIPSSNGTDYSVAKISSPHTCPGFSDIIALNKP